MSDEPIDIPATFWRSVTRSEFLDIIMRGGLNAEQCAMLWRMTDRQGPAPDYLQVLANREDVQREFPPPGFNSGRREQT